MKNLLLLLIIFNFFSCQNNKKEKSYEEIMQYAKDTMRKPHKIKKEKIKKVNKKVEIKTITYERDTVKSLELKNKGLNLLINNGNLRDAEENLMMSIMYNNQDADTPYILGNVYQKLLDYDLAYSAYQRAIALKPNHIDAIMKCAILANKTKTEFSSCYYLQLACNLGEPKACEGFSKFCKN